MEQRTIVKREDYAILYSDGTMLIKEVRASYAHLFEPYQGPPDPKTGNVPPARWGIVGLMPKTRAYRASKDLIRDHINQIVKDAKLKDLPAANKFLRDGDLAAKPEYEGMYTINAGEVKARPPALRGNVRDPKTKKPVVLRPGVDDAVIQSGYWVNLLIRPWFQNNTWGKKVNASLIAVQLVREDEVFGQGRISDDDVDETFDEFADDDDSGYSDALGDDDDL
jgi:hypothetical protein